MRTGRPKAEMTVLEEDRKQLKSISLSRNLPHSMVMRAKVILMSDSGMNNTCIAKALGTSIFTVSHWRNRYIREGLEGLHDEFRSGRPRSVSDEAIAMLVNKTLQSQPTGATHWTIRAMASKTGLAKSTVHRVWQAFGLQPHKQRSFKLSTDPLFVEKVRDIVGLYLNPPDKAIVLCVDEKSQIQALDRTQPALPMGLGYSEGVTHDYIRHGTTTLFAALDVANGSIIGQCKQRHRHQEYLEFLRHLDKNIPAGLDVHIVADNYATHKHPSTRGWMANHPRYHVHYTPTAASWLNQVEIWFNIITKKAIKRGAFQSVADLKRKIMDFIENYNQHPRPFKWAATAESIMEKLKRLCDRINGTRY